MSVVNFIDSTATLGAGTRVWHFAVVLADVSIGAHCSVGSGSEIGRGSTVGDYTRIGQGVFLPPSSTVGKGVFIGPHVVACDDKWPKVGNSEYNAEPPIIEDGASVGAGAVLLPGVRIGAGALVGAGAVVTRDVPPGTVLRGEPARVARQL